MSYGVKFSWHPPVGMFSRKADAQAMAKRMREAHRQAGLKGTVKVVKFSGNPSKRSVRKRVAAALRKFVRGNPHRVKGRKVKGGRAVTLKNMKSVTITRHSNAAVSVRGVQLKGRKR